MATAIGRANSLPIAGPSASRSWHRPAVPFWPAQNRRVSPGRRYTFKAEKNGFQTLTVHPVDLEVQQKGTLDLALTIGATRDSVAVSAIVSPIQAHDASVSYRLDAPEILELPLVSFD